MGCMAPLQENTEKCARCGYERSAPYDKQYSKPGAMLGERYILGRLVRKNGESALYLGYDNNLQTRVWIREYFPPNLCMRNPMTGEIRPKEGCGAQYKALLADYIDLCQTLKQLGQMEPVVPVETVFSANGTAYAVYKYLAVSQFEHWLSKQGGKLPVQQAQALFLPLCNALSNIHARGMIHRGISPYTVYIGKDGRLYLWDFCLGATRTGGSELQAELFNGYSAPEQYTSNGWQGPWTDIYAVAALLYRTISGFVPPKSIQIAPNRPLAPLSHLAADVPQHLSDAVMEAMHPRTEARIQEMSSFVSQLIRTEMSNTAIYDASMVNEVKQERERAERREKRAQEHRRAKYVLVGMVVTVVLLGVMLWAVMRTLFPEMITPSADREDTPGQSVSLALDDESSSEDAAATDNRMPNLVGQKLEDVQNNPLYDRFVFEISEDYNSEYGAGEIYNHSPSPDVVVPDGRTVILYVSQGKKLVTMPDLSGKTPEEVSAALRELAGDDTDIAYTSFTRYSDADVPPGTATGSEPAAGEEFDLMETNIRVFFLPEASQVEIQEQLPTVQQPSAVQRPSSSSSSSSQPDNWREWALSQQNN